MARWAILGNVGEEYAEFAFNLLKRKGPFTQRKKANQISFALSYSKRGSDPLLQVSNWMDRSSVNGFSLNDYKPTAGLTEIEKTYLSGEQIATLQKKIFEDKGISGLNSSRKLIMYSSITQHEKILKSVIAPKFFGQFSNGNILFITPSPNLNMALSIIRILGAAIDLTDRNLEAVFDYSPSRILIDSQGAGIFQPGKHLTIPLSIFLPRLYGFSANKIALAYLFIFDEPISDVRSIYPRSGLEFIRSEASNLFHQNLGLDFETISPKLADKFCLIEKEFSQNCIQAFIKQYLLELDGFLHYIIDPSSFIVKSSGNWGALSHYQAWLCFERVADEVLLMLTDDTSYLRKASLFRILDQLASLASKKPSEQVRIFKEFVLPDKREDVIFLGLSKYSGEVANHLKELLRITRLEILDVGINSIFLKELVDWNNETVTLVSGFKIPHRDFVVNLIRELRNSSHGYYTRNFEKYLAISTGDIPESIVNIGFLAYFAFIARPDLFIRRSI